jgi:hypothetical protein
MSATGRHRLQKPSNRGRVTRAVAVALVLAAITGGVSMRLNDFASASPTASSGSAAVSSGPHYNTLQRCMFYPGNVVQMCVTMHYVETTVSGDAVVAVHTYTYTWTRVSTAYSFVSGDIHMGVVGRCEKSCGSTEFLSKTGDCKLSKIRSAATYTCTPSWAGEFVNVAPKLLAGQGANTTVVMRRGSKTSSFFNEGVVEGSFDVPGPA